MTEKQALLDSYGHTSITLSSANTHSYEKLDIAFPRYLKVTVLPGQGHAEMISDWWVVFNGSLIQLLARPCYNHGRWTTWLARLGTCLAITTVSDNNRMRTALRWMPNKAIAVFVV